MAKRTARDLARPGGWLTLDELRQLWADCPADDFAAQILLDAAQITCVEHSLLTDADTGGLRHWRADDPVPADYLTAQRLQAMAIWRITQATPSDDTIGFDQSAVRVWPMSNDIRQLLRRPRRPVIA
jgi:hypothetical protein